MIELPEELLALLYATSTCYLATVMPDGSPQLTQTWADTDGKHLLINTVQTHQKVRNIRRDPRVAVTVSDPSQPARYFRIRGRVVGMTTDGAAEHIDRLSERYLGRPYPWFGGRDQVRVLLTIEADSVGTPH
ncbi:PPOX class F420-dependent oxidoreductase [Hamadaea tsunoensis]|uniref:PPOX class F420-dependent oxidoreductase n=1 Tax=Hamadaea tsunoensis TaxID=53368 RepID=UPI0003FECD0A|nr:PPOX class F420-dependent oxidoreductase [Hamadaea tsunoensis]